MTTTGGLIRYDGYEKLVFTEGSGGLTSNFVPCVFEDSEGLLWIVTLSGLDVYDKKSGKITNFHPDPSNSDITESTTFNWAPRLVAEDQAGGIWIGSTNGLFLHDKKLNTFEKIDLTAGERSTPANHNIWNVLADSKGRIWVGTSAGLDRYNPETQTFTHFRHTPGVAGSLGAGSVYAIYEDDQGTIWVGTGKGGDGLQGDSFSLYGCSALKDREGRLWFAGLNGVNSFFPNQLRHNSNPPQVYLLSLSQGGEELVPRLRMGATQTLSLGWRHNYFEFEYVGLNYSQPQKNQYKYTLEGWDNDWFFAGNKRFGRYSGLSGGNYTLKVMASNNDGVWSEKPVTLHIHVETPVWSTWWFYSLLALAVSSVFMLFYLVRMRQLTRFNTELEVAYSGVQRAENKYRSIFENAIDGIFQLTAQGTLISANPAAVSILRFSTAEQMRVAMVNVRHWVNSTDSQWRKLLVQLFREGAVADYELPVRRNDGEDIWLAVNLRVITDESVEGRYIDGLMEDITIRKHTGEQLHLYREHLEHLVDERTKEYQRSNADLQMEIQERERVEEELLRARKLESIGVLAGGIAHDFNNLITIVLGNINMAQLKAGDDISEELQRAVQALDRARKLTEKFITFSSGGEPVKESLDIEEVTRSAVSLALSGSNLQARFDCDAGLARVDADRGHINQAMNNIVENSKQAMPDGGILDIRISKYRREELPNRKAPNDVAVDAGDYVAIDFIDHGFGITPQDLPRVFDPYFTTAALGSKKGKGLGLTIAYSIVKKHGGTLSIESTPGQGTHVCMVLPGVAAEERGEQPKEAGIAGKSANILLMDDEEMLRDLATAMLHQLGHEVDTVADGSAAISAYTEVLTSGKKYDVVILDLTIPGGMGGREVIKLLHQLDPSVKAVVSSGYSSDPLVSDYRSHGFIDVLSKPYDMATLRETLNRILHH